MAVVVVVRTRIKFPTFIFTHKCGSSRLDKVVLVQQLCCHGWSFGLYMDFLHYNIRRTGGPLQTLNVELSFDFDSIIHKCLVKHSHQSSKK